MDLNSSLNRFRTRLRQRIFLRSLATSAAVSFAALGLLLIISGWQDWGLSAAQGILVALAITVASSLFLTLRADTSLARTARLLESADPTLHARLSTALEVSGTDNTGSPLRQALIADASMKAAALNPRDRIRLVLPRPVTAGLIAGSVLLAAGGLLTGPLSSITVSRPAITASTDDLSRDESTSLASSLQQLAEQFAENELAGSDPYLQAITRRLQDLSNRVETDDLSREQVSAELDRLLQHANTALELQESSQVRRELETLPEMLQAALRDVNREESPAMPQEMDQAMAEGGPPAPDADDAAEAMSAQAEETGDSPQPSLQDMLDAQQEQVEARTASDQGQRSSGNYYDRALDDSAIAELNERAMEQAMTQAAGAAIGAAAESEAGASSLAGEGTDDLFGSEEADRLNAERLEQMAVPEETDPEGRQVRVEVAPEAELTEIHITPLGEMSWNRTTENTVAREPLVTNQRLTTARYHTPEQMD